MAFSQRLTARGAALVQRLTGCHGDGKDVTDPRELYTILSQAETKRNHACTSVPVLVTDATLQYKFNHEMKIRVKGYQPEKRPNTPIAHHKSSLELYDSTEAELPTLTLVRQSSSLEDLTTLNKREKRLNRTEKPTISFEHFPRLHEKHRLSFDDTEKLQGKYDAAECLDSKDIVLPKVPKVLEKTLPIAKPAVPPSPSSDLEATELANDWQLAGVPSEFVGRTKQILMEETFRERLRARGLGLNRNRSLFPRDTSRITDLKAYDLYPGQYWELRADSVQRPEDLELDMIDRDLYRMKQKSILKLKVVDGEWKAKTERVSTDIPSPQSQRDTHRSLPRRAHAKPKFNHFDSLGPEEEETVALSPVTKLMLGPVIAEAVTTGQHETDSLVGPPNSRKTNRNKLPYILSDEPLVGNINNHSKHTQVVGTTRPKYVPPTTVVNLSIDQEIPRARRPRHIEENMQKQKQTVRVSESAPTDNTNGLIENGHGMRAHDQQRSLTPNEVISDSDSKPSASSRPTDDKNKKSLLTGFKKLEVFGETKPRPLETTQAVKAVQPTKYLPQCHPPMYKLDMRNYPPQGNMIQAFFGLERPQENVRGADNNHMSLRVIDGEVIFTKVQTPAHPATSRTVKSESTVNEHSPVRDTPVLSKS